MKTKQKNLITQQLDIEGLEIGRVARQAIQRKILKRGNIGEGAKLRDLASLYFEHHLGGWVAKLTTEHEGETNKLRGLISKLRKR